MTVIITEDMVGKDSFTGRESYSLQFNQFLKGGPWMQIVFSPTNEAYPNSPLENGFVVWFFPWKQGYTLGDSYNSVMLRVGPNYGHACFDKGTIISMYWNARNNLGRLTLESAFLEIEAPNLHDSWELPNPTLHPAVDFTQWTWGPDDLLLDATPIPPAGLIGIGEGPPYTSWMLPAVPSSYIPGSGSCPMEFNALGLGGGSTFDWTAGEFKELVSADSFTQSMVKLVESGENVTGSATWPQEQGPLGFQYYSQIVSAT